MTEEHRPHPEHERGNLTAPSSDLPAELAPVVEQARHYAEQSRAENTRRAYRADWTHFNAWCNERGLMALPAEAGTIALYLSDLAATLRPSTLQRRITSIRVAHREQGLEAPSPSSNELVRRVWRGIRREHGVAQDAKTPVLIRDLRAMVEQLPDRLIGLRDRALLLLGFAGGFRRSELVGLNVADLELVADGVVVTLRRSKTDQQGEGRKVGIPFGHRGLCPVQAVESWLEAAQLDEGPLFRQVNRHGQVGRMRLSDRAVALVVKRSAERAGLDPANYAGHSLRAGLATAAAMAGASERAIMAQTGHRSERMVRRYIRDGELFRENAAAVVL